MIKNFHTPSAKAIRYIYAAAASGLAVGSYKIIDEGLKTSDFFETVSSCFDFLALGTKLNDLSDVAATSLSYGGLLWLNGWFVFTTLRFACSNKTFFRLPLAKHYFADMEYEDYDERKSDKDRYFRLESEFSKPFLSKYWGLVSMATYLSVFLYNSNTSFSHLSAENFVVNAFSSLCFSGALLFAPKMLCTLVIPTYQEAFLLDNKKTQPVDALENK
jgi:hypothetical protein